MAFQADDDDDGSFAFANAQWVDTNPEDELESNVYQSNREYTIFAIDCHGCNYLKPVPTKNLRSVDPKQSKIVISQLENIIQAIINYLRSHIIQSPDAQHAVFFYNTSERNQNGIHVLEFQNGKQMHTLSKDYILQLMGLENLMDFHHKIGLSDKLEGSTPFAAVIDTIQTIFRDAITPGVSTQHLDRKVLLFTPFENPPLMPYQICLRRCNTLQDKSCTFRGQTKSLITIQQECVSDAHRTTTLLDAHRDHSEITWILFPLQNSFPDLYQDVDKADNFTPYNLLHSNTSLSQLSQLSQNSIDYASQSSQSTSNGGSLSSQQQQQQQQQAPVYAGSLAAKQHVSLGTGGVVNPHQGLMDKYNFTPEILINSLNFGPDLEWMKSAFASSIATNSQSQSTQTTQSTQSTKNNTQQPNNIKDFYQTTLLTQQAALSNDDKQRLNRKITKLTFSPTYFENLFPECAVSEHIRAYQTQIRDLKELNQIKQYKKRALVTVPFYLPMKPYEVGIPTPDQAVFFGVDIFPQFIETKPQVTTDVKLEPTNHTPIQSNTRQLSISGDEITPDDICHWFPIGAKEALFIDKKDIVQIKKFGPSSIRVLGFKEHDGTYAHLMNKGLSIADNIQRPYLCYPNEIKYPGSGVLFGDLVQMCYVSNRFIVAQFIPKLGAIPRLVYLLPVLETRHVDDDGNNDRMITPTCFQLIFAPFQEDIRSIDGPTMSGYSAEHPIISEVEDALGLVLDAYQQKSVGTKGNELVNNNLFDLLEDLPSMHKMACRIAVTEHLALGIPLQLPEDTLALGLDMKHIDPIIEDAYAIINEHLPGIGVEKVKATRGKKAATADTGDGDGTTTTKKAPAKRLTAAEKRKATQDAQNSDNEDVPATKTAVKKAVRGKKSVDSDDDVKAEPKTTTKKATTTRKTKATTKVETESDYDNDGSDDDDEPKKSTRARKPAATKATTTKATTTTGTGRGRKAAVKTEMNDESDEEEEDVKPKRKATVTRGKKVVDSSDSDEAPTTTRKTARKFLVSSSEEEEESEVEEKPKRGRKPAVKKEIIVSDDEDEKPVRARASRRK